MLRNLTSGWRGKIGLGTISVVILAVVAWLNPARQSDSGSVQKHSWFTHCEGPEFRDVTKDPAYGQSAPGVIVKINNNLILAPPASVFPHYLGDDAKGLECRSINDLPQVTNASFRIRASALRGPEPSRDETFDPDVVSVHVMPEVQAPSGEPSMIEKEHQEDFERSKAKGYPVAAITEYGLRCYGFPTAAITCFGSTTDAPTPDVVIGVILGMKEGVHANYYSSKYGGIGISWLTGTDTLPKWKAIATQIFADLDSWNALQQGSTKSATQTARR